MTRKRLSFLLLIVWLLGGQICLLAAPTATSFSKPTSAFSISNSRFGSEWLSRCPHGIWKRHVGVDTDLYDPGLAVKAMAGGLVRYAGSFGQGWGQCVILEHNIPGIGPCTSLYGHIRPSANMKTGKTVRRGDALGVIDGSVSPPHLHFGIRLAPYGSTSIRGALPVCGKSGCSPQFPEKFVDPVGFLADPESFGFRPSAVPISPGLKTGAVDLAVVFDCSNSMVDPPDKMERAKQATYSVIDAARSYDQISLVSFAYRGWLLAPPTSPGSPGSRGSLKAKTAQIAPDDWTNIGAGLELAYGELVKVPGGRFRSILLLTDGGNNQGSFWPVVNKCQQARIPVYTVAYGVDADRPTLSEIAKRTGGVAYLAGPTNLTQVYQRISAMSRKASVLTSYQGRIGQGDRHIYPVLIPDDIRRAWFGTDWEGSRVEVSLVSPSGKEITSRTPDSTCADLQLKF